jgi:hypothetical protein
MGKKWMLGYRNSSPREYQGLSSSNLFIKIKKNMSEILNKNAILWIEQATLSFLFPMIYESFSLL